MDSPNLCHNRLALLAGRKGGLGLLTPIGYFSLLLGNLLPKPSQALPVRHPMLFFGRAFSASSDSDSEGACSSQFSHHKGTPCIA